MKKKVKEYEPLPFEIGKTYLTKYASGDMFTITRFECNKVGKILKAYGLFEEKPYREGWGEMPMELERLNPHTRPIGRDIEYTICPHCKKSFIEDGTHG